MISLGKETIDRYGQFIQWTETLRECDDTVWFTPIAEGKATVADIISHLKGWDYYLLHTVIPAIRNGEGMVFPNFDSFNQKAYEYARSGISKLSLLDEFKQTRITLINTMMNEPDVATKNVTANGVEYCPHTGTPYSLLYIIYEFIEHDLHHKTQILSVI